MKKDMYEVLSEIHRQIAGMQEAVSILDAAAETSPIPSESNETQAKHAMNLLGCGRDYLRRLTNEANEYVSKVALPTYFELEKVTKVGPGHFYPETTRLWLEYHKHLTGKDGAPGYTDGCLFHWIAEHEPRGQGRILDIMYEAGYEAGVKAGGGDGQET